ncbi:MAG: HEPN domain-containing protein [Calditrichae bacterium]|nr:HEPN domain-containing protein [Calditrichia bacterium]
MNSNDEVQYRLKLAEGFLTEAEEDYKLKRWRSCVDNAQVSVEDSGKAILTLFGVSPKTHEPAKHLGKMVNNEQIPDHIRDLIKEILPEFLTLGLEEHFMTDYGDESTYTLPWELFTAETADSAFYSARQCYSASAEIVNAVIQWRSKENENDESE